MPSIDASGGGQLVATLTTKDGLPIPNQTVAADTAAGGQYVYLSGGSSAVTDANGVAKISIKRTNLYEFGTSFYTVKFAGSALFNSSTSSNIDYRVDPPLLNLVVRNDAGVVTTTIGTVGASSIVATLRFADGTPVTQKRIEITGDLTKVSFPEGASQITDSSGTAVIRVVRATGSVGGAGTLAAAASISGATASGATVSTVVTGSVDYSIGAVEGAAKLVLTNLNLGATSLPAYGTRQVSVQANLGSVPSPTSVLVNFTASCGQIQPASVVTNAAGVATVSYSATDAANVSPSNLGCSDKTVEISASAVGADPVRRSLSIDKAPATNLAFVVPVDPTKMRIYLEGSGGATQAVIQFILSNAVGEAIPSQDILLTLKTTNSGIPKATFGTKGNTAPITLTTDSAGKVSVPVFSGTVPTSVLVNAALATSPTIQTNSSVLAIASGRPTQSSLSLSLGKFAIRGFNFDGEETTVTLAMADRQGNPVPDGTAVNFTSEGGVMIPPICTTGAVLGDSRCTVKIRTQGSRPADGRVSILAYTAGEENFIDSVGDNVYHCGDVFTDLGIAYRDNSARSAGVPVGGANATGQVPRSASVPVCGTAVSPTTASGDGVWGTADVRQQAVVVFSTDDMKSSDPVWTSGPSSQWAGTIVTTRLSITLSDLNNNSVPTGSTIAAIATDATATTPSELVGTTPTFGTCSFVGISNDSVPNSLDPLPVDVFVKDCVTGDQVKVTVTTPYAVKSFTFAVP